MPLVSSLKVGMGWLPLERGGLLYPELGICTGQEKPQKIPSFTSQGVFIGVDAFDVDVSQSLRFDP